MGIYLRPEEQFYYCSGCGLPFSADDTRSFMYKCASESRWINGPFSMTELIAYWENFV